MLQPNPYGPYPSSSTRITLRSKSPALLHPPSIADLSLWTDSHYAKPSYELSIARTLHQGNFLYGLTHHMLSDDTSRALLQPILRHNFPFEQITVVHGGETTRSPA